MQHTNFYSRVLRHFFFLTFFLLFPVFNLVSGEPDPLVKKAKAIHQHVLTIDSHNDAPLRMVQPGFDIGMAHDARKDYSRVDFPRMKEGGLDGAFFGIFLSQGKRNPQAYEKIRLKTFLLFDTLHAAVQHHPDQAGLALTPEDAIRLKKEGRRALFIGIENGYAIGKDLSLIKTYFDKGARYITLCHTRNNDICDSSTDTTEFNGLSPFGFKVVEEMNRTGMMIDVSHISDKAFLDVLSVSKAPVIASHSCARALCDNPRNLSDSLLVLLARQGGVIQMCILSDYVKAPEPNPARDSARAVVNKKFNGFDEMSEEQKNKVREEWMQVNRQFLSKLATVKDVVDHIDHIVKVAGIDHVGIGTDFDGGGGVEGCYDVSEMGNITLELVRRGYSRKDISKIWGGNLMRVMKQAKLHRE